MTSENETGVLVAPAVRDLDAFAQQFADWFKGRVPGAENVRITGMAYPRGAGQSHETILFDANWTEGGHEHSRAIVVRIKPSQHTVFQDDMFFEQYEVMRVISEGGQVPVAQPLWFEEDPGVLGAPFFVMEKVLGRVAVSIPSYMEEGWVVEASPAERACLWEDGVRTLAAVQKVPLSSVSFLLRPEAGDAGMVQELDRWERYLAWIGQDRQLSFLQAAFKRLCDTMPANQPQGLVWGDARLGNMMVGPDFKIVAVMDWEQPSLGGALHDLGWWLYHERMQSTGRGIPLLEGLGSPDQTIALWSEASGLSAEGVDWYEAFAGFKMACLGVRMMELRGLTPPDNNFDAMPSNHQVAQMLDMEWPSPGS